jgi:hypothetical protein
MGIFLSNHGAEKLHRRMSMADQPVADPSALRGRPAEIASKLKPRAQMWLGKPARLPPGRHRAHTQPPLGPVGQQAVALLTPDPLHPPAIHQPALPGATAPRPVDSRALPMATLARSPEPADGVAAAPHRRPQWPSLCRPMLPQLQVRPALVST